MVTKKSRKFGLLAAASASTAAVMFGGNSFGAVTLTLTNLGTPSDTYYANPPGTTTYNGYTAYSVGLTASSGNTVDNIQAGGSAATTANGFFGALVQDWEAVTNRGNPTGAYTPTPQLTTQSGTSTAPALDSHFIVTPTLSVNPPNEDNPGGGETGVPANGGYDLLGTGTFLQGNFSFTPASAVTLAYIVVKNGTTVNYNVVAADGPAGLVPTNLTTLTGTIGAAVTTTANKIISLVTTGTAPTGNGSLLGTLTVQNAGGSGKYFPGYLNITPATTGYVAVQGFLPNDQPEVYALQVALNGTVLTPTDSRLANIISEIRGSDSNIATVTNVSGSSYAALFPNYDILLTSSVGGGSSPFFAFDFSGAGDTDGAITVTSIAAVPEPATASLLILGSAGMLLRRRHARSIAV